MPIPNLPNFNELLQSFTFDKPNNFENCDYIQIVDKSYGTDFKSGRYIPVEFPEINLWYKPSDKLSVDALIKKIQAELEIKNHPNILPLAKIVLAIVVLHKKFQQQPVECLNKALGNITSAQLKQIYIFAPMTGRGESFVIQGFIIGSFAIGGLNPEQLKNLCRKADSDYYDKFAREYVIKRLCIEQKLISVNVFDFVNIKKILSFPIPLAGIKPNASSLFADEMLGKLMSNYFYEISIYLQEKFWERLLEEQHLAISYGAPYLDIESKKFINGSNFITIFLEIGGKENAGWVEPASLQPSVDFAKADIRIPKAINSLRDKFNFTDFRDSEIHQTIKSYSLFISKAKRHYIKENNNEAFLHYVIALDLLLGEKGASTKSVTDRTAVLTYRKFNNSFESQQKAVNNLYNVRSKYVHAGKNIESKYIKEVELICEEILHCLLRLQMKEENHSDGFIKKWLKNLDFLVKAIEADKEQERKAYVETGIEYDEPD